ncbi:MAG: hypothetical protein QOJ02_1200 [Acidobacteriota bacterium]|jgi:hypothetical protein|nr:hypothetical protein [Acidobacteriota bacterium]
MKALNLALLMLLLVSGAAAQEPSKLSDAPGTMLVKNSWRRQVRNPALDEDPLTVNEDEAELERARKETTRRNVSRVKGNQEPLPLPNNAPRREMSPPFVEYIYEATISNTGEKTIRKLIWEYVLFDPKTEVQVGQHRFTNEVNIRPGKSANLVGRTKFPPAGVVDAKKAGNSSPGQYSEQIVIYRIEYKDGPAWERH